MKTIRVNHNPASEPIRFPVSVTFLTVQDDVNDADAVEKFAEKGKQVIITYERVPNQWLQ